MEGEIQETHHLMVIMAATDSRCYEWTTRVTRLESCCSDHGDFGFGFGATGP